MSSADALLFLLIEDLIGPSKEWPLWIKNLFFKQNLNHSERPLICSFIIFNGLDPEIFYDWVQKKNLARDQNALKEIKSLCNAYKNNPEQWKKIYTFCTKEKKWYYIDGVQKIPKKTRAEIDNMLPRKFNSFLNYLTCVFNL